MLTLGCAAYDYSDLECRTGAVWDGDVEIRNAAQLDRVAGYPVIDGELVINATGFHYLEGLRCLEEVGGRLYLVDNDASAYLLEEWREGLPNGFRLPPGTPVAAIAADEQEITGWPACMQSFLSASWLFTPTRTVWSGTSITKYKEGVTEHDSK